MRRPAARPAVRAGLGVAALGLGLAPAAVAAQASPARPSHVPSHVPSRTTVRLTPDAGGSVLVVVRLGHYASGSVLAIPRDGGLLVPVRPFLALAGVRLEARGGRLAGVWHPAAVPVVIDPAAATVGIGRRRVAATAGELATRDGQVYAAGALLERAFDLRLRYDTAEAVLTVENPDGLPVAQRVVHAARLAAALDVRRAADHDGHGLAAGDRTAAPGVLLDYAVTRWGDLVPGMTTDASVGSTTTGALGLAVPLGGGVLTARATAGPNAAPVGARGLVAWTWDRPDGRGVRQFRVGDAESQGLRVFALRGVLLSNAAPTSDRVATSVTVRGLVPPGWSVEAYRAGSLLALDSIAPGGATDPTALVDGADPAGAARRAFALQVPVHAGQTMLDLVAVGPDGQLRNTQRVVQVMPLGLAAHAFEYRLAAGACHPRDLPTGVTRDACRGRLNADVRYGLTERWAVRGGVDATRLSGAVRASAGGVHPYVAVAGAPWNALSLAAEHAAGQLDRGSLRFQPSPGFLASTERTVARDVWMPSLAMTPSSALGRIELDPAVSWRRSAVAQSSTDLLVSPRALRGVVVEAHDLRASWSDGAWQEQRLGAVAPTRAAELRSYVRRETVTPAPARLLLGASATVLPARGLARVLGRSWMNGLVEVTPGGTPARAELTMARPFAAFWRVDVGAEWDRRSPGYRVRVGLTSQLPSVRATTQASFAGAGERGVAVHTVSGAALVDGQARTVAFVAEPALDRGSIAGRVFLDLDGNGRRDRHEPGIPRAQLQLATRTVTSDARGDYRVIGVPPDAVVQLTLDSASLTSPWWVPAVPDVHVRAVAGRLTRVDYPVVLGGIVNGRVVGPGGRGDGEIPAGARVVLSAGDGRGVAPQRADVLSDGGFAFTGVPPGRYLATVELPAGAAEWRAEPVPVDLEPASPLPAASALDLAGPLVEGVALVLRREPSGRTDPNGSVDGAATVDQDGVAGAPVIVLGNAAPRQEGVRQEGPRRAGIAVDGPARASGPVPRSVTVRGATARPLAGRRVAGRVAYAARAAACAHRGARVHARTNAAAPPSRSTRAVSPRASGSTSVPHTSWPTAAPAAFGAAWTCIDAWWCLTFPSTALPAARQCGPASAPGWWCTPGTLANVTTRAGPSVPAARAASSRRASVRSPGNRRSCTAPTSRSGRR